MSSYDLVVVGGGIHGAGVAQAAAVAGYSVLVLEQSGLAAGTSSRSSKLIHGGLRYLESGQFGLVRECLHERTLLLKLAPDLVRLQPFYIPIYRQTSRRPLTIRAGLSLYALLGGMGRDARFSKVARSTWDGLDGLATHDLQAVYRYYDGQTDDVALTRAVMASAQWFGASLAMPAELIAAELGDDGCAISYREAGEERSCSAKVLINAAGPWVNEVVCRVSPAPETVDIELVQGTHLILEGALESGIYYMEAPQDQRAVFAIPWKGKTMVGTTENPYQGNPATVEPLATEEEYLQQVMAHYFPERFSLTQQRIVDRFAGSRVLPMGSGNAFSRPRDTVLKVDSEDSPKMLSIYGGKLTAYRITAEKVMQRLQGCLPERKAKGDVKQIRLEPVDE